MPEPHEALTLAVLILAALAVWTAGCYWICRTFFDRYDRRN